MAAVTMSVFRELRQGVPDGSIPLYVASIQTKVMAQSNPIVGLLNTLTVTIAASSEVPVPMGSVVTLQGLTGIVNHPESFTVMCSPSGIRSGA